MCVMVSTYDQTWKRARAGQGRGAFDHAGWELMRNMYLLLLLLLLFWIEIVLMGAKSRSKEV